MTHKTLVIPSSETWDTSYQAKRWFAIGFIVIYFLFSLSFKGWSTDNDNSIEPLLRQYILSKGSGIISFDPSNIKQFWIDNSVVSQASEFKILLNESQKHESNPLKLQLANVNETLDCRIEIIASKNDFDFSVLNNNMEVISTSANEDSFLLYNILSSSFHLEDTTNVSFYLKFSSSTANEVSIKRIILSFSPNKSSFFHASPGSFILGGDDVVGGENKELYDNGKSFSLSGKRFTIFSKNKILVSDKPVTNHVTIKNVGNTLVRIYFGYAPFTSNGRNIRNENTPYKSNNMILNVISSEANSNKIVVDSYPDWEKGCYLALNAKEDLSDFPNFTLVKCLIDDIIKKDDIHTEILFDHPIQNAIKEGTKARIHSKDGNIFLYTHVIALPPGDETTLSSTITKDDSSIQFSPKAFCRGTYYVVPIILSHSVDPKEDNTILIRDFTVSY